MSGKTGRGVATATETETNIILPTEADIKYVTGQQTAVRFTGPADEVGQRRFMEQQKQTYLAALGDLSGLHLKWDRVMLAIWRAPEKSAGGIVRPDSSKDEDVWQGCVGLYVHEGPYAWHYDEHGHKYEDRAEVGDWVLFRRGSGVRQRIRGVHCVIIQEPEKVIQAVLKRLDLVDLM